MNIHDIHVCVISETFRSLKDDPVVELKERQQATALASVCAVTIAMRHEHENDKYSNGFCVAGGISLVVSLRISSMCIRAYWQTRVDVNRGQTTREADGRRGEQRTLKVSKSGNASFGTGPQLSSERR